jgi:hypothetical protein
MPLTRRSLLQLLGITALAPPRSHDIADTSDRGTRLESFVRSRGIMPAHLAREAGYSRQHLLRLRVGRMLPSLVCIARLTLAAQRLTRERVTPTDLFPQEVIASARAYCKRATLAQEERAALIAAFGADAFVRGA